MNVPKLPLNLFINKRFPFSFQEYVFCHENSRQFLNPPPVSFSFTWLSISFCSPWKRRPVHLCVDSGYTMVYDGGGRKQLRRRQEIEDDEIQEILLSPVHSFTLLSLPRCGVCCWMDTWAPVQSVAVAPPEQRRRHRKPVHHHRLLSTPPPTTTTTTFI